MVVFCDFCTKERDMRIESDEFNLNNMFLFLGCLLSSPNFVILAAWTDTFFPVQILPSPTRTFSYQELNWNKDSVTNNNKREQGGVKQEQSYYDFTTISNVCLQLLIRLSI